MFLDELPAFRGVFAHVEGEKLRDDFELAYFYRREVHCFRGDELLEFFRVDFTKTFEPVDFTALAEFFLCGVAFCLTVAVDVFLFISYAEKRGFEDEYPAACDQFLKVAEEECEHEVPDVEAVVIGIGCDYDF